MAYERLKVCISVAQTTTGTTLKAVGGLSFVNHNMFKYNSYRKNEE